MQHIQHAQLFSGGHIILILLIVLLLFGGRKIPELMKGLGQGIKEFKDASKNEDNKPTASNEKQIEEK
ncbi:MAG: twin-arginine translocase TatA/TatE family subunit [Flavobacteriales bacterium]